MFRMLQIQGKAKSEDGFGKQHVCLGRVCCSHGYSSWSVYWKQEAIESSVRSLRCLGQIEMVLVWEEATCEVATHNVGEVITKTETSYAGQRCK